MNRRARQLITSLGGEVVREVYADPETPDVEELAREVLAEKPDIIVSSLVGWGMYRIRRAALPRRAPAAGELALSPARRMQ